MLEQSAKNSGGRPSENRSSRSTGSSPTLSEIGITKNESSRFQQLAAMPEERFEAAVATAKAIAGEVSGRA